MAKLKYFADLLLLRAASRHDIIFYAKSMKEENEKERI